MKFLKTLIILLTFAACSKNKSNSKVMSNSPYKIDTVKYSYSGFNHGSRLGLLSNGSFIKKNFVFGCTGGGFIKIVFGIYQIDSTNLKLIPKKVKYTQLPIDFESKPKTIKVNYGVDSLKIKTKYQIVTWGNKKYLLSDFLDSDFSLEKENDYIRFAYYVNNGLEPNSNGIYLVTEIKDSIKIPFDLEQIPEKWRSYFLREPISTKITKIKKIPNPYNDGSVDYWFIELNKGTRDGMNNKLSLTTKDDDFLIEIDSVLTNRSFGSAPIYGLTSKKIPVGTELRTKWK
ncbi:hypothetical protein F7018_15770 [Tenacibaculum aiptasiae]|uniref:Uncharacterized protein n=1 Tax=Tenacibaculum aiptasiae TaxID=426481 RepID=A0A7J5A909_9FLAO|nr:hypothetical protein [Tenacibaculum aiptasiae]KAB1153943.1 hypothetical protein F7018_15770 [Tenacibaculum aiptasiae]